MPRDLIFTKPSDVPFYRRRGLEIPARKWLDGNVHVLRPGVDYTGNLKAFRAKLWREAQLMGRNVQTKMVDGYLYVQALDNDFNPMPGAVVVPPAP